MKQGWTYKKLGEVCEVISGQSPEGKYYNSEGKGTPFYQGKKDFTSKYIGKPTVWTTEETKIAEKDDLLMSVRAPVGDVNFATQRLCIGRGLAAIRSKDNLNKEYLFYFLLAIKDNIKGKEGVGFASINRKEIMDIDLKYPTSLPEQQRIVSRLDSAFAHIDELKANAEKQVNEARALFQKALSKAMEPKEGWEEKKLGQLCRIERGGSPRPIKQFITDDEDGLNWIKIGDTDPQGKYIYSTKEKIRPEGLKKSRWVEKDEFLLSNSMSFGRPYILKTNGCIHDGWLVLRDYQKNLFIDFFYYLLTSANVQNQFKEKAQGSTVSNLNTDRVASTIVQFPPLSEQQRIVERLDSLSANVKALEENQRKVMAECDALKQALLRKVFE